MNLLGGSILFSIAFVSGFHGQANCNLDDDLQNEHDKARVVYNWNIVEYEWPSGKTRQQAINNDDYIPRNSAISGIKVYKNRVFVTVLRQKAGVPATLGEVVENTHTSPVTSVSHILRPYPNWAMQKLGRCESLQKVQSMEIDPKTGYMWIVDTGYVPSIEDITNQPLEACPAKIVIYDLNKNKEVSRYNFPTKTMGQGHVNLNDIVLEVHQGVARYAYMSDTLGYKLVVYDFHKNTSYSFSHPNMKPNKRYENITISKTLLTGIDKGINGLAMSPDFKYLYYSSVAGVRLNQIETGVLRSARGNNRAFAASVRTVGTKVSPGDGMVYGSKDNLYYSALPNKSIFKWEISKDLGEDSNYENLALNSQTKLVTDKRMEWIDSLTIDECGYLWFTTNRLNKFLTAGGIVPDQPNFFVWKMYVDDYNYLDPQNQAKTAGTSFNRVSIDALVLSLFLVFCGSL